MSTAFVGKVKHTVLTNPNIPDHTQINQEILFQMQIAISFGIVLAIIAACGFFITRVRTSNDIPMVLTERLNDDRLRFTLDAVEDLYAKLIRKLELYLKYENVPSMAIRFTELDNNIEKLNLSWKIMYKGKLTFEVTDNFHVGIAKWKFDGTVKLMVPKEIEAIVKQLKQENRINKDYV